MEGLTLDKIKNDVIEILKRCGIAIYVVELIKCVFSIYSTYQTYITNYTNNTIGHSNQWIYELVGMIIIAVLTIITIVIINNSYEKINTSYIDVIKNSVKKLPKYILGYFVLGLLILVGIILSMFIPILSSLIAIVVCSYIMIRFCLLGYVLILEDGFHIIRRNKELYMTNKSTLVKYFFAILIVQLLPTTLLTSLPNWLNIELSMGAFLSTRIAIIIIGLVLSPIINIVGLSIYKYYIGEEIK